MANSVQEIKALFSQLFPSKEPKLFFSPGRINLIGEHIDYNDGFVLPAAVDKGIWFAVAENHTNTVNIYSADMQETLTVPLNQVEKITGWQNYLLGVIDQLNQNNYRIAGFDCVFGGNIPVGAGLSSSAAVECGLGFALNSIFQLNLTRVEIALTGQKAEHTFPGVQCGIMDQFANMMGEEHHVLLLDCNTLTYETVPFQLSHHVLILINSKVHHSLAGGEYNIRRRQCEEGFKILQEHYPSAKTFRDISPQQVIACKQFLPSLILNRCLFVTAEIARTKKAAWLLKEQQLNAFGNLVSEAHDGLSTLYDVSCPELDFLQKQALQYPQVLGSRMMGGGFGGCTLNLVEKEKAEATISEITSAYEKQFGIHAEVYTVNISNGTHALS